MTAHPPQNSKVADGKQGIYFAWLKLPGHQPGNREVPPGWVRFRPSWDLSTAVVSLGKKLYLHCLSHTQLQLLNSGTLCVMFRKNSLWLMLPSPAVKITGFFFLFFLI